MIEINLIAAKKNKQSSIVFGVDLKEVPWIKIIFCYFLYSFSSSFLGNFLKDQRSDIQEQVNNLSNKEKKLKKEVSENRNIEELLMVFNNQIKKLEERSSYVDKIIKERTNPRLVLEKLARSASDNLWFEELIIDENKKLTITGGSDDYKAIGTFLAEINNSPFFKRDIELKNSQTKKEMNQGVEVRYETFNIEGNIDAFDPFRQ